MIGGFVGELGLDFIIALATGGQGLVLRAAQLIGGLSSKVLKVMLKLYDTLQEKAAKVLEARMLDLYGEHAFDMLKAPVVPEKQQHPQIEPQADSGKIEEPKRKLNNQSERLSLVDIDDITKFRVLAYSDAVNSNKPWKWREIDSKIKKNERKNIKDIAEKYGLIEKIDVDPVTRYADFDKVKLMTVYLPENLWDKTDSVQFRYLDKKVTGRPIGTTWHHHQDDGRMDLIPFGIHNITSHSGGRKTWANGKR